MAEAFFVAGLYANACIQAQDVAVSSAHSVFGKAALQNGDPWDIFRFGAAGMDLTIRFDNNMVRNSTFESDTQGQAPAEWKTEAGTPTVEAAPGTGKGSNSLQLDGDLEASFMDFDVVPGATYRIQASLWDDSTNGIAFYVIDLLTDKYWTGATWTNTETALFSTTSAAWQDNADDFTLDAAIIHHSGPGRLRLRAKKTGAGTGYVDEVYLYPKVTVASLHYYRHIGDGITVDVQSSTDDAAWTTRGAMPTRRYRNYVTFAGPSSPERYWRYKFTGTTIQAPEIGQPLLGERQVFQTVPDDDGYAWIERMPRGGTESEPTAQQEAPRFIFRLSWRGEDAEAQELADELLSASRHGEDPVMIVPEGDKDAIVYGRGPGEITQERVSVRAWRYSISVVDDLFPRRPN